MRLKGWWIQLAINLSVLCSASAQQLILKGTAFVKISYHNPEHEVPVNAEIFQTFPAWEISKIADTISPARKEIWLSFPIRTAQEANIFIQNRQLPLLMIPGDTVYIDLRRPSESLNVEFGGKTKAVQEYYMDRFARFPIRIDQLTINLGLASPDLRTFKAQADSLYLLDQQFWDECKQKQDFPAWFLRYESDAILYRNAYARQYAVTYQTRIQQKGSEIPPDFFGFLGTTSFRNEPAMYDFYYMRFLWEYLRFKAGVGTGNFDGSMEFRLAKELLGDKVGDFYILYSISYALIHDPDEVSADLAKITLPMSSPNGDLAQYLLDRAEAYSMNLSSGDTALEFYVENKFDSLVSLSQFKNYVVYLSFWFPGCKGCIHEFPFENALVEKFKGKPVKIINICTLSSKSKWIATVKKYDLQTLNRPLA